MTVRHHDSIMVMVDKLSKEAHFIPVKSTHMTSDVARIALISLETSTTTLDLTFKVTSIKVST